MRDQYYRETRGYFNNKIQPANGEKDYSSLLEREKRYYAKKLDKVMKVIDTYLNNCKSGNRESIKQSEKELEKLVENYKKGE